MSKYYKVEDIDREIERLLPIFEAEEDFDLGVEHGIETVKRALADLIPIEIKGGKIMFDKFEIVREGTYYTLYADGITVSSGYLEDLADTLTDFARDCKEGQGGKDMLSHDYLSEFFTDYVIEHVIDEFCNLMEDTDTENSGAYHFMRGCAEPHLKLYESSDEVFLNYKLEGVVICKLATRETRIYDITGLVSTLNGGNIRISAYESRPY